MMTYVLKRVAFLVPTVLIISFLTLALSRAAPGSPFDSERALSAEQRAALEAEYCLDRGVIRQYFECYLPGLLRGDLGVCLKYKNRTVNELIFDGLPVTLTLGALAIVWALFLGVTAGVIGAVRQNSRWDYSAMAAAMLGISVPSFVLAPVLILVFSLTWQWFPAGGWGTWRHVVLPALTLGTIRAAYIARLTRGGMLDIVRSDFVRTARAKGLAERTIIWRHMLRGGLTPVVTYLGPALAATLVGSVVVETIFATPGIGPYFVAAAVNRDHNLIAGIVLVYATLLVVMNLLVDISYRLLDPRVRLG